MDRIVLYIPSYDDSELVQQSLATVPDWDVIISDNASAEPHRAALARLAGERVQVIHQEKQLGRVGNWKFCVRHFVESGAGWMKFLPAGDRHKSDSLAICQRALAQHPDARFVITNAFKAGQASLEHFVEEALVRMRAADLFGQLTGDRLTRNQLHAMVGHWLSTRLDQPPGAA